jgi:hypothetical protein
MNNARTSLLKRQMKDLSRSVGRILSFQINGSSTLIAQTEIQCDAKEDDLSKEQILFRSVDIFTPLCEGCTVDFSQSLQIRA